MLSSSRQVRVTVPTPYDANCPTVRSRLIPLCTPLVKKGFVFTFLVIGNGTVELAPGIVCRGYKNYGALLRIIIGLRPEVADVVFASKPYSITGLASFAVARLRGLAYVLDVDDRTFPSEINKWWRIPLYIQEWCFEWFLRVVRPLTVVASLALAKYWGQHVTYIPNSADLDRFTKAQWNSQIIRERFNLKSPVVVWPAVFFQETDREYVLQVFRLLQQKKTGVTLLVIGDGEYLPEIRDKVQLLQMKNVVFAGRIPYEEMPHYYAAADAGMLPLRNTHYDACKGPIKLYEYMSMELPIIATDIGEPKALLEAVECGILIPFNAPEQAATMITGLLSSPACLEKMGKAGRRFLVQQQSFECLSDKLHAVLTEALGAARRRMI